MWRWAWLPGDHYLGWEDVSLHLTSAESPQAKGLGLGEGEQVNGPSLFHRSISAGGVGPSKHQGLTGTGHRGKGHVAWRWLLPKWPVWAIVLFQNQWHTELCARYGVTGTSIQGVHRTQDHIHLEPQYSKSLKR